MSFIQCITRWYSLQYYNGSRTWISTNVTNIYLASIRFGTLQHLCNTLYKSHHIPTVLGILPYNSPKVTFQLQIPSASASEFCYTFLHELEMSQSPIVITLDCYCIQQQKLRATSMQACKPSDTWKNGWKAFKYNSLLWEVLYLSLYTLCTRLFLKTYTNLTLHVILTWHRLASKLATTNKMTLMYLFVIIHINNQSTLYKVNGVVIPL
jgi:hypothetical protein